MRVGGLRLHVGQVQDSSIICHKGSGEWYQGVLHPEALRGGLLKHKQHAFVLRHLFAKHQANAALVRRLRHLRVDLIHARLQLDAGQVGLGRVLGQGRKSQARKEEDEQCAFHAGDCIARQAVFSRDG